MGITDVFDKEVLSEKAWKMRCRLLPHKEDVGRPIQDIEGSLSDEDLKKQPAKNPTFGVDATVKTLYEGKNSCGGVYDWVDFPPKQMSKKAAESQDRPAIKVYKIKDMDKPIIGGRFSLAYHQISIQNPTLVAALEPILKKEDFHIDPNDTATFEAPFRPLFFCYDDILDLYRTTDDSSLKGYLQLLVRTLDDVLGETREKKRKLQSSCLIHFKMAWTYFPRGSVVYSSACNTEMLCKVEGTAYERAEGTVVLNVNCKILTFNGETFVWSDHKLQIPKFAGNRPIRDLDHYPLQFHEDKEGMMRRTLARGTRVLDLQGLTYCTYTGVAVGEKSRYNVEGRILVDVVGFNKYERARGKREQDDANTRRNRVVSHEEIFFSNEGADATKDADPIKTETGGGRHLAAKKQQRNKEEMLAREDDLVFMSPLIEGFALKNKVWLAFYVEDIAPITWNDTAYDHLVYDEQQKDLVLSFVENHGRGGRSAMEDVIVGKGQGLIILLSGPPGTGKTLTAEAVADRTHRPLFYLQAEDLGINPSTLGEKVKRVFEMATEWDAVVLLDEADVFMAERNPNDIARNELVSIFLRELEYFRGIIFLTTNLYNTIDTAFRSRVSLHLLFKALSPDSRGLIWRKFLGRLPPAGGDEKADGLVPLSDEDIKELGQWQLNGREIKTAVKMVSKWCDHKGYEMSLARLENGIRVTSPHASKQKHAEDDDDLYN
ncbi:ATPase [Colletotrichum graminicola]|uniref:ATPase n=1 Tax=Colletotrichum graminicola (strain M1.001 / M2 / FGSC 10212) TaxID=645133 RepID=E3QNI6_COLGM|nr:ATPase [Colletotrichum graminicola M1.001]EFQ32473.1 ATPase [Colletotrichum graminicola M1.001]WDK14621.1 ATPase [Colletotrichum graminicola]